MKIRFRGNKFSNVNKCGWSIQIFSQFHNKSLKKMIYKQNSSLSLLFVKWLFCFVVSWNVFICEYLTHNYTNIEIYVLQRNHLCLFYAGVDGSFRINLLLYNLFDSIHRCEEKKVCGTVLFSQMLMLAFEWHIY